MRAARMHSEATVAAQDAPDGLDPRKRYPMLLPKPPKRKAWQYERPSNVKVRDLLAARCQEQGVQPPDALHGVQIAGVEAGQQEARVMVLADAWPHSPRDAVRVGDGVCGCLPKSARPGGTAQARARWVGLVMEVEAWDRGEPRAPIHRNGRRAPLVCGNGAALVRLIQEAQALGQIAPHAFPEPTQAPVVFVYRIALLAEGALAVVTIPRKAPAFWTM